MAEHNADIIIFGAGIAGLWACNALSARGYNVLLLENEAIGAGQTLASQGIIHSGLKYMLGGKINPLAKEISAMPARWQEVLKNDCVAAPSQQLLITKGAMGKLKAMAVKKVLGKNATIEAPSSQMKQSGFDGTVVTLNEPVLDVAKVLRTITDKKIVRKITLSTDTIKKSKVVIGDHVIRTKLFIFATGNENDRCAAGMRHDIKSQHRPLLMGMLKKAPFALYAHLVGNSDKPIATITTHHNKNGDLIWYIGGLVAERPSDSDPYDTHDAIKEAFAKFLPKIDLAAIQWSTLPIDRAEGNTGARMPGRPVIQRIDNAMYCWPTKLTFAPLLADMIIEQIGDIGPSHTQTDWSFLPHVEFADAPWDKAAWRK